MSVRLQHVLLITSLLLNIFFMSWAASQWLKQRVVYASLLNEVMYTIPAEARPLFRKHLKANQDELMQALKQLVEARHTVGQLVTQPELDRKVLDEALAQIRKHLTSVVGLLQQVMTETMQDLPTEVRQEWALQWQRDELLASGIERLSQELAK